jgi:acid phosphatase class B
MEKKITKKAMAEFLKTKLSTDEKWAVNALLKIYARQTASEQIAGVTAELNGVGFSGKDSVILSSFAKFYQTKNFLSPKQMSYVFKLVPRYWKQIFDISDKDKLIALVEKNNIEKVEKA